MEILLARAPGRIIFGKAVADRLVGQRVPLNGWRRVTVASTEVRDGGRTIYAQVEFDPPKPKLRSNPGQQKLL